MYCLIEIRKQNEPARDKWNPPYCTRNKIKELRSIIWIGLLTLIHRHISFDSAQFSLFPRGNKQTGNSLQDTDKKRNIQNKPKQNAYNHCK